MASERFVVATFNVNSVRVRLQQLLDWMAEHRPDVVGLQETKVRDDEFPAGPIEDAGYHVAYRGAENGHAGVALLSRQEPRDLVFGLHDGEEPDEARFVRCVIGTPAGDVALLNTYVPQGRSVDSPHFQYKLHWFERVHDFLQRHYAPDDPILWMGDLNVAPEPIDIYDPKRLKNHVDFHPDARAALEEVMAWGLVDLVRLQHPEEPNLYSYYDYRAKDPIAENKGWRVDHILGTEPMADRCTAAWIDVDARRAERPSDHTLVVAEFEG